MIDVSKDVALMRLTVCAERALDADVAAMEEA